MSKILTIDEMLALLKNEEARLNPNQKSRFDGLFYLMNVIGTETGKLVAEVLGVKVSECTWDNPDAGGHACFIGPAHKGQEMPGSLAGFDDGGEWDESEDSTPIFTNHYHCDACNLERHETWSCGCNDKCPKCNREIQPYESEEN